MKEGLQDGHRNCCVCSGQMQGRWSHNREYFSIYGSTRRSRFARPDALVMHPAP
jgi:aspartate carbamoyltransferase catalytic subunit